MTEKTDGIPRTPGRTRRVPADDASVQASTLSAIERRRREIEDNPPPPWLPEGLDCAAIAKALDEYEAATEVRQPGVA